LGDQEYKSKTISNSLNPEYEESFELPYDPTTTDEKELKIEVWDYDRLSKNDLLGSSSIKFGKYLDNQQDIELNLISTDNRNVSTNAGKGYLTVFYERDQEQKSEPAASKVAVSRQKKVQTPAKPAPEEPTDVTTKKMTSLSDPSLNQNGQQGRKDKQKKSETQPTQQTQKAFTGADGSAQPSAKQYTPQTKTRKLIKKDDDEPKEIKTTENSEVEDVELEKDGEQQEDQYDEEKTPADDRKQKQHEIA
ncbi:MAG: hypothetical protein EZS28_052011, partial [Streblomastix strix]